MSTNESSNVSEQMSEIKESMMVGSLLSGTVGTMFVRMLTMLLLRLVKGNIPAKGMSLALGHFATPTVYKHQVSDLPEVESIYKKFGIGEQYFRPLSNRWLVRSGFLFIITLPNGSKALLCDSPNRNGFTAHYNGIWCLPKDRAVVKAYLEKVVTQFGRSQVVIRSASTDTSTSGHTAVSWTRRGGGRAIRPLKHIPLASGVRKKVEEHLAFLKSRWNSQDPEARLTTANIALVGLPGSAKTSVAYAMAMELAGNVTIFPVGFSREDFWNIVERFNAYDVVLADEADSSSMFKPPVDASVLVGADVLQQKQADISDVLAYLTGPRAPDAVTTVVITNNKKKMDPRAFRKGRFREEVEFGNVDSEGIRYYLTEYHKLDVPADYQFCEDINAATIFALEESCDDPNVLMEKLRTNLPPVS